MRKMKPTYKKYILNEDNRGKQAKVRCLAVIRYSI